jgi:hypothetical protein
MTVTKSSSDAWIELPSDTAVRAARGGQSHPYDQYLGGVIAKMARLIAAHDSIGPALGQLSRTIMFGPGTLSRAEREMVASVAAAAQRCHY